MIHREILCDIRAIYESKIVPNSHCRARDLLETKKWHLLSLFCLAL